MREGAQNAGEAERLREAAGTRAVHRQPEPRSPSTSGAAITHPTSPPAARIPIRSRIENFEQHASKNGGFSKSVSLPAGHDDLLQPHTGIARRIQIWERKVVQEHQNAERSADDFSLPKEEKAIEEDGCTSESEFTDGSNNILPPTFSPTVCISMYYGVFILCKWAWGSISVAALAHEQP